MQIREKNEYPKMSYFFIEFVFNAKTFIFSTHIVVQVYPSPNGKVVVKSFIIKKK